MKAQREHANSTQKRTDPELTPEPSCCVETVLTTAPLCYFIKYAGEKEHIEED